MTALTLSQISSLTRSLIMDNVNFTSTTPGISQPVSFSPEQVTDAINWACKQYAILTNATYTEISSNVNTDSTLNLPSDSLMVVRVRTDGAAPGGSITATYYYDEPETPIYNVQTDMLKYGAASTGRRYHVDIEHDIPNATAFSISVVATSKDTVNVCSGTSCYINDYEHAFVYIFDYPDSPSVTYPVGGNIESTSTSGNKISIFPYRIFSGIGVDLTLTITVSVSYPGGVLNETITSVVAGGY